MVVWTLILSLAAGGVVTWGSIWGSIRHNRRRLQAWARSATACGLEVKEATGRFAWQLKLAALPARAEPLEVLIGDPRKRDVTTRIVVVVPGPPGFAGVRIRRELLNPLRWVREVELGDEPFDSAFYLGGPPRLVCALLDVETRRLLADVHAESRLEIVGGEIQVEMLDVQVAHVLPLLLDLGRRLARPEEVAVRLAENARHDPVPAVRLQNLLLLVREFVGHPVIAETLHAACSDTSPEVRLRAAIELGAEGRGVLAELAESPVDDAVSAQAVSALASELPLERTRAILAQALRRRRLQTASACLEALGKSGAEAVVDVLVRVMALEKGELAVAAALALGITSSTAAEPPLIKALQRDQPAVRTAAATALARVGSAAAVLPLKDLAERSGHNPDVLRAARQAIAMIQSRLPGASPGQLSLAGDEAGQLSLADAEAGRLSLAADQAGQLSLSGAEERLVPAPRRTDTPSS